MRFQCPNCLKIIDSDTEAPYRERCSECGKNYRKPQSVFASGCIINGFIIRENLGSGSIGGIYRAERMDGGLEVALKILSLNIWFLKGFPLSVKRRKRYFS